MRKRVLLCGLLLTLILLTTASVQAAPVIETVRVELNFSQGARPAAPLIERMQDSLTVISEHLLRDRSVELVSDQQADYQRVIRDVTERVLTGYDVDQVALFVGPASTVSVTVRPWGPTVAVADVRLQLSGVSAAMLPIVRQDLGPLEEEVQALLIGLSQDAVDWSGGAVKAEIRRRVEKRLPEFQAAVDVSSGDVPVVNIVLLPVGQTIQNIQYQMTSGSIPNILLVRDKEKLDEAVQALSGLPVPYAQRRKNELAHWLEQKAAGMYSIQQYRLKPVVLFEPGALTQVQIQMESDRYRVWIEGRADLNHKDDKLSGKLHAGKFFSAKDEVFLEVNWLPSDMSWSLEPGYARHSDPWTIGAQAATDDRNTCWWVERKLNGNWRLRTQFQPEEHDYEFSLRYRIHEFLSVEAVAEKHEQFLRLVGNL